MKEFFAFLYDTLFGIFNQDFDIIYTHLFDNGGYSKIGIIFIFIPIICWCLFYIVWKYPYGKILHWFIWLLISVFLVFVFTINTVNTEIFYSNNQALNDALTNSSFLMHANSLPIKYSFVNGLLSIIFSFFLIFPGKNLSKIQTHLPF